MCGRDARDPDDIARLQARDVFPFDCPLVWKTRARS